MPSPARANSPDVRWQRGSRWLSRRAVLLHVAFVVLAAGCLAAGWWQVTRALSGNGVTRLYSVRVADVGVRRRVGLVALIHEDPEVRAGEEAAPARVEGDAQGPRSLRASPRKPRRLTSISVVAGSEVEGAESIRVRTGTLATVGDYVALTKPRIIELLLITTVPTMFVAAHRVPSIRLMALTVLGGALAAGGRQRHEHGLRPRHRRDDGADETPAARHRGDRPRSAAIFATLLEAAAFAVLWLTVNHLGRPRARRDRLLPRRLHDVAQAILLAEHRHRRCGRRGAGPRRLDRRHGAPLARSAPHVRDHLPVDATALLGAGRSLQGGLLQGEGADAPLGREPRDRDAPDHRLRRCSRGCCRSLLAPLGALERRLRRHRCVRSSPPSSVYAVALLRDPTRVAR